MKLLALAVLTSLPLNANVFESESLIILEQQMGDIYSHPLVREAAEDHGKGVVTLYLDPVRSNTRTERSRALNFIRERVVMYNPKTLYISGNYFDVVPTLNYSGKVVRISQSHAPERNSKRIDAFVKAASLPENFYILYDNSANSKITAHEYKTYLSKTFNPKNVKMINIKSFQDIRNWLSINNADGIILNCMTVLLDTEISKFKFALDIKEELQQRNRKYFDIGFQNSSYNEALVVVPDYKTLYQKTFKGANIQVDSIVLANQDRIKALGKFSNLADAFKLIDGIVE